MLLFRALRPPYSRTIGVPTRSDSCGNPTAANAPEGSSHVDFFCTSFFRSGIDVEDGKWLSASYPMGYEALRLRDTTLGVVIGFFGRVLGWR